MRGAKFQESFTSGIDTIVNRMERREVGQLPESVNDWRAKQETLLQLAAGSSLTPEQHDLVLTMFNDNWETGLQEWRTGRWTHWCASGCCATEQQSKDRAREALTIMFMRFPSEPLLYRWKHWEPFLEWPG